VVQVAGVQASTLTPADVTAAAMARVDAHAITAVQLFASFLGNVAGNLALTLGARGGVYVGGGIVPRLGERFDAALFRRRFEEKGRFNDYLAQVPTWVITAATPALVGAAQALDDAQLADVAS
jgi:glucokinase